jgi:hypothetical protein
MNRAPNLITINKSGVNAARIVARATHGVVPARVMPTGPGRDVFGAVQQFGVFRKVRPWADTSSQILMRNGRPAWRGLYANNNSRLDYSFPNSDTEYNWQGLDATVIIEAFKRDDDFGVSNYSTWFGAQGANAQRINNHLEGIDIQWDAGAIPDRLTWAWGWGDNSTRFPVRQWHTFGFLKRGGHRSIWVDGVRVAERTVAGSPILSATTQWSWYGHPIFASPYNSGGTQDFGLGGYWDYALTDREVQTLTRDSSILRNALDRQNSTVIHNPSRILRPTLDLAVRGWSAS